MRSIIFCVCTFICVESVSTAKAHELDDEPHTLWFAGMVGYSYMDLGAFRYRNLYPSGFQTSGWGPLAGVGLGVRIGPYSTVGIRLTGSSYSDFGMWRLGISMGLKPRFVGPFAPYFRFGVGYVWMNEGQAFQGRVKQLDVTGFSGETGVGFDIFVTNWLSLGPAIDIVALFLSRDAISSPTVGDMVDTSMLSSGSAIGVKVQFDILRVSLHFL